MTQTVLYGALESEVGGAVAEGDRLWIPLGELQARAGELPRDRPLVIVCRSGARSGYAADALVAAGYEASNLAGGLHAWVAAALPLVPDGGYVL